MKSKELQIEKREFNAALQVTRKVIFEVSYHRCGGGAPYFSTSATLFNQPKTDYARAGQCQRHVLAEGTAARAFFERWDGKHLEQLSDADYLQLRSEVDELKGRYNFLLWEAEGAEWGFGELKALSMRKLTPTAAREVKAAKEGLVNPN